MLRLVNFSFAKEHGIGVVLERVRAAVKKLEEGVLLYDKAVMGSNGVTSNALL